MCSRIPLHLLPNNDIVLRILEQCCFFLFINIRKALNIRRSFHCIFENVDNTHEGIKFFGTLKFISSMIWKNSQRNLVKKFLMRRTIFFPTTGADPTTETYKGFNYARCKYLHFKWLLLACIMFDTVAATEMGLAAGARF